MIDAVGTPINIHSDPKLTLMHRWRYPSLSLHGIEGAFHTAGDKTVIPAKVIGKFSIRTVPNMTPENVEKLVIEYCREVFHKLGSKNTIQVKCSGSGRPWVSSFDHWNFGILILILI